MTVELKDFNSVEDFIFEDEVHCVVKGCDWRGKSISHHISKAHNIKLIDLKDELGVGKNRGLMCNTTKRKFADHPVARMVKAGEAEWLKQYQSDMTARNAGRVERDARLRRKRKKVWEDIVSYCDNCGEEFIISRDQYYSSYRINAPMFCSMKCRQERNASLPRFKSRRST